MSNCLLIHLGVGLLSAFFGFLLGCLNCKKRDYSTLCGAEQHNSLTIEQSDFKNTAQEHLTGTKMPQFNAALAKQAYNRTVKENDLKVIEGIGPKIQHLFHNYNIKTWKSLANCSVEKCQYILDKAGEAYRIHNPKTWPKQARMAYEGKWQELRQWQDKLDAGR
jgi:predicted flap endonuclease-1-like 5' DNA nuclease